MRIAAALSSIVLMAGLALPAAAGYIGHPVHLGLSNTGVSQNATVGPGIEFNERDTLFDLSDRQIDIFFSFPFGGTSVHYGGSYGTYQFYDYTGTIDGIVGVTIDPATLASNFGAGNVFFDSESVYVTMSDVGLLPGWHIILDVRFAGDPDPGQAPLPPTLPLFAAALGALAVSLRRRA